MIMNLDVLRDYVKQLANLSAETEWIEFKHNNCDPQAIGERVSALSNSALIHGQEKGFLLFGVTDKAHTIVGTTFKPEDVKKPQGLENWLSTQLDPAINVNFYEFDLESKPMVILEIDSANGFPTKFKGTAYVRVDSHTHPLTKQPGKEQELWKRLDRKNFEKHLAMTHLMEEEVLNLLDYETLYRKMGYPLTRNDAEIIKKLKEDKLIIEHEARLAITNLGAILFAKDLSKFPTVSRRYVRVIVYNGNNKSSTKLEQKGAHGYAIGIDGLIEFIMSQVPSVEKLVGTRLIREPAYPKLAVRELVMNALIHQDFSIDGTSPMIEIYDNRVEITNAGAPLVDIDRIIDHSPRSRNEDLAGFMARMWECEERGSGVDKVVIQCELRQLPAPLFTKGKDFIRATLWPHRSLRDMTKDDKVRATYYHAVIKWLEGSYMTNATLRDRFGIDKNNYPTASKIIKLAIDAKAIKLREADTDKKYVPFWV